MKKIILSMIAVFAFGIASAQTDPKQVPTQPEPLKTGTEVKDKAKQDAEIQNDVNRENTGEPVQPRKDEIKTRNHVKSTPNPERIKDTVTPAKKMKKAKKRS